MPVESLWSFSNPGFGSLLNTCSESLYSFDNCEAFRMPVEDDATHSESFEGFQMFCEYILTIAKPVEVM